MAKKIAGQDRPYTIAEFFNKMYELAKERGIISDSSPLDYFIGSSLYEKSILKDPYFLVVSKTNYGSNEGIYTDFNIEFDIVEKDFATAKTLDESDESFMYMSILGAKFSLMCNEYVRKHQQEFKFD